MIKPILFVFFVVAQLGALGWMVFERHQLAANGTVIRLECEPVDPTSLLSGDYVILNFKISRFDDGEVSSLVRGDPDFKRGQTVWIALKKNKASGFHEASAISADREQLLAADGIVIRGQADRNWGGSLRVRYGLEQYFVPQFEGKEIEKNLRETSVDVAVDESGASAVVRLFVSGVEVTFH